MTKRPSLLHQVQQTLQRKLAIGQSRHAAKAAGTDTEHIYSWGTYHTYLSAGKQFTDYCKKEFGSKTLSECRAHADDYLASRETLSAWTQARDRSALCKIYGESSTAFRSIPTEKRADITRSRGAVSKNFSENRNRELVDFCRSTGLRRSELSHLRGDQLTAHPDGSYTLDRIAGKGGKIRSAPVIGSPEQIANVVQHCQAVGSGRVWARVPSHAPVHAYRADYATSLYKSLARDTTSLPRSQVYCCRTDRAGIHYDRAAMLQVSKALGHNRISVIASSYLK